MIKHLRLFSTLLLLAVASILPSWGQSDYSAVYTSNVTLSAEGGSDASICQVKINEVVFDGIKAGTGKRAGKVVVTAPQGTKYLHFHIAGWNGATVKVSVSGNGYSGSFDLISNSGISNNSPFTFNGEANSADYYKVITFNSPLTSDTQFTFTATSGNRFVLWGVNSEEEGTSASVATPTFSPAGGTYVGTQDVTISTTTDGATVYFTTNGTDPTTSSSVYSEPISVSETTTIKAIAYVGEDASSVASATYTIVSIEHEGTAEDPYTVADARNAIDANTGVTDVYATGIVSKIVTAYSSQYSNITFDLVDEEGNAETVQAYRCTGEEADDVQVGDVVVVKGNLTKYNTTYEFAQGCEIVSRTSSSTQVAAGLAFSASTASADLSDLESFTAPTLENPNNLPVIYTSSNTEVATVAADGTVTILAEGKTTITVSSEETEQYLAGTASYTLTVTNSNKQLVIVDADGNITFDLSDNGWGFPEGSSNKTTEEGPYTADGYTITLAGGGSGNGHYFNSDGYLILGKSGATLTLPVFEMPVERIEVVGNSGASGSVVQNIYVGETAVSTATTGATGTNTYVIAEDYKAAGNVYTLKVTSAHNTQITKIKVYKGTIDERANAEIAFSTESLTITQGKEFTAPTFSNPNNVAVTFSTDKADVASWNNGLVLGTATGTAVITATFEGNDDYKPATATLTVTVKEDLNFVDVTEGCGVYQKVTSASDLEAGKRYLMVYETQDDDLNDVADVFNGVENKIGTYVVMPLNSDMVDNTTGTATHPIVLQSAGSGNWYLMDGDNFLYWTSGNYLYCSDVASQAGNTWSVNFGEEGMSINNVNTPERYLQFNTSSPRFACYTGTQKNVVLYKELMVAPITVTIGKTATGADGNYYSSVYYSDKALQVPAKVECQTYKMTDGKLSVSKTYAAGSVIPADEAVVIKASVAGKVNFVVTTTTEQKDANSMLKGCDEATTISEPGFKYYKLTLNATKDAGTAGFYFDKNVIDGSTINAAAHKCYLRVPVNQTNGAKGFVFGEETDGIGQIENGELTIENSVVYDLSGRKLSTINYQLSTLPKGIYIVNGKKVVVK